MVVTPCMGNGPGVFQDQVAHHLTGRLLWRQVDRKWEYTSAVTATEEAGFETMEEYIW